MESEEFPLKRKLHEIKSQMDPLDKILLPDDDPEEDLPPTVIIPDKSIIETVDFTVSSPKRSPIKPKTTFELQQQVDDLEKQVARLREAEQNVEELKEKLKEEKTLELNGVKEKLKTIEEEKNKLSIFLEEKVQELEKVKQKELDTNERLRKIENQCLEQNEKLILSEQEISTLKTTIVESREQIEKQKILLMTKEESEKTLFATREELEKIISETREENQLLEKRIIQSDISIESLEREKDVGKRELERMEKIRIELMDRIQLETALVKNLEEEKVTFREMIKKEKEVNQSLVSERDRLKGELETMREKNEVLGGVCGEKKVLEAKIRGLEEEINVLKTERLGMIQENKEIEKERDAKIKTLKILMEEKKELEGVREENKILTEKINAILKERADEMRVREKLLVEFGECKRTIKVLEEETRGKKIETDKKEKEERIQLNGLRKNLGEKQAEIVKRLEEVEKKEKEVKERLEEVGEKKRLEVEEKEKLEKRLEEVEKKERLYNEELERFEKQVKIFQEKELNLAQGEKFLGKQIEEWEQEKKREREEWDKEKELDDEELDQREEKLEKEKKKLVEKEQELNKREKEVKIREKELDDREENLIDQVSKEESCKKWKITPMVEERLITKIGQISEWKIESGQNCSYLYWGGNPEHPIVRESWKEPLKKIVDVLHDYHFEGFLEWDSKTTDGRGEILYVQIVGDVIYCLPRRLNSLFKTLYNVIEKIEKGEEEKETLKRRIKELERSKK